MNAICHSENVKKATTTIIWDYLMEEGLVAEEETEGRFVKSATEQGRRMGIEVEEKVSQRGFSYQLLIYPEAVQRMVVEYFTGRRAVYDDGTGKDGSGRNQKNTGLRWTEEEDARLIAEFKAGMKLSEIAMAHGRTNGAVISRLQRYGMG